MMGMGTEQRQCLYLKRAVEKAAGRPRRWFDVAVIYPPVECFHMRTPGTGLIIRLSVKGFGNFCGRERIGHPCPSHSFRHLSVVLPSCSALLEDRTQIVLCTVCFRSVLGLSSESVPVDVTLPRDWYNVLEIKGVIAKLIRVFYYVHTEIKVGPGDACVHAQTNLKP